MCIASRVCALNCVEMRRHLLLDASFSLECNRRSFRAPGAAPGRDLRTKHKRLLRKWGGGGRPTGWLSQRTRRPNGGKPAPATNSKNYNIKILLHVHETKNKTKKKQQGKNNNNNGITFFCGSTHKSDQPLPACWTGMNLPPPSPPSGVCTVV